MAEVLKQNIGDSSGSEGGGFRLHAMGGPSQVSAQPEEDLFALQPI